MKRVRFNQWMMLAATFALTMMANTRCMFCYHQPEQPKDLKKFRKF